MDKCNVCGKTVTRLERKQVYNDKTELYESLCLNCYEDYQAGKISFKETLEIKEEKVPIIERKEIILEGILKNTIEMKNNLHTIYVILLFFFILFIIGLFFLLMGIN